MHKASFTIIVFIAKLVLETEKIGGLGIQNDVKRNFISVSYP